MSWADEKIAHPMGYEHAVLFPRARDAITTFGHIWCGPTHTLLLPQNICPEAIGGLDDTDYALLPVDDRTGLAAAPVQLYGYRETRCENNPVEIDPLMTGWGHKPICESSIVSFGLKKFISVGHGGAFLTNSISLVSEMCELTHWPFEDGDDVSQFIQWKVARFLDHKERGFNQIAKWDAALGDLLPRIPLEQVIPWRVMRRVPDGKRDAVVRALRRAGQPVGTNYPPLTGSNKWGDEVINFFPDCEDIRTVCAIIEETLNG